MVWGTFFGDKVPQSARLSAGGGGGKSYSGNAQCLRHVFEKGFLTTAVNSGVNICPNNGLTIQGLDFGTYFLKFFRSILEPFHQDYCYFHDKNGKTIFGKVKRLPKANIDTP